jgi:hypothetical protein
MACLPATAFCLTTNHRGLARIDSLRDWGHARDYVEMQWRMLQQQGPPEDFVLATCRQESVRRFVALAALELGWKPTTVLEELVAEMVGTRPGGSPQGGAAAAEGFQGGLMVLPEQAAGKGLECWIEAHQGQLAQLRLSSQKPIKGIAMGHGVTAGMEAMQQGDRQRFKALSGEQLGQIVEQLAGPRQLAQAHLGGDLPARRRTHMHPVARVSNGPMGSLRKAIGLGQPPQQGMGVEQ